MVDVAPVALVPNGALNERSQGPSQLPGVSCHAHLPDSSASFDLVVQHRDEGWLSAAPGSRSVLEIQRVQSWVQISSLLLPSFGHRQAH